MTLSPWQATLWLAMGLGATVGGVALGQAGMALVGVGSGVVGAVLGMFTARSPQSRTRASDRRPTVPELPVAVAPPWDPEKTPPPRGPR